MIGKGYELDKLGQTGKPYGTRCLFWQWRPEIQDIPDLTNKANFLVKIGNYNLAIIYYDKSLAIDPKNSDALKGKEQILALLNQAVSSSS